METKDKMILLALVMGTFMTALDATIVAVALPTMAQEFGEAGHNTANISWVLLIYTLMLCCFIMLWSKLGSNIGYKKIFMTGILVFSCSSLAIGLCGLSPSIGLGAIILLRAVQGLGAGMAIAVSLAMVSVFLPTEIRGRAIGAVSLSASVGTAFGPALGGMLTTIHWSYIFFINLPIGLICFFLSMKFMTSENKIDAADRKKVDVLGVIFMFIMMFALVFYLNKGQDIGWMSAEGIVLLFVMFIAAGLLVWWERRAGDPLLSLSMLKSEYITKANVISLILFGAMAGSYLLLPYYLQYVQGYETIQYGFILIANSIGMMVTAPIVGKISDRTGNNKILVIIGSLVLALGLVMIMAYGLDTELWYIIISLFVMGAGIGITLVSVTNIAFGYVKPGEDGQFSGLNNTFKQAGSSAGVAILNTVFMSTIAIGAGSIAQIIVPGFRHAIFVAIIMALVIFVIAMGLKDNKSEA